MSINDVVAAIDAIDPVGDPESAHSELDDLLLSVMPDEIKAAVARLIKRAPWWAAA